MVRLRRQPRDGREDDVHKHALGRVRAGGGGRSQVMVVTNELCRGRGGARRQGVLRGRSEGHQKAAAAEGGVIFRSTVRVISKVQVGWFPDVLGDVVGRVARRFDKRAVDVAGISGDR